MDNLTDTLQTKIAEARARLAKESVAAIDTVNWKLTILGMGKRYNEDQIDNLETETELLLCGITNPDDFPKELETRMHLSKEEVILLIGELDKQVFKKIQDELEKRLITKEKVTSSRPVAIDPRFISLPKEVQNAISHSNWKETLYEIASSHRLNIEQMVILEDITVKVISNSIHPDKYESELASKITIPTEDISSLVSDINEKILSKIRELLKVQSSESGGDDDIPLPPYSNVEIKKDGEVKIESSPALGTYSSNFIVNIKKKEEVPEPVPSAPVAPKVEEEDIPVPQKLNVENISKNIMEEKLKGVTVSEHSVSDHSIPKIKTPSLSNPHDPYREVI